MSWSPLTWFRSTAKEKTEGVLVPLSRPAHILPVHILNATVTPFYILEAAMRNDPSALDGLFERTHGLILGPTGATKRDFEHLVTSLEVELKKMLLQAIDTEDFPVRAKAFKSVVLGMYRSYLNDPNWNSFFDVKNFFPLLMARGYATDPDKGKKILDVYIKIFKEMDILNAEKHIFAPVKSVKIIDNLIFNKSMTVSVKMFFFTSEQFDEKFKSALAKEYLTALSFPPKGENEVEWRDHAKIITSQFRSVKEFINIDVLLSDLADDDEKSPAQNTVSLYILKDIFEHKLEQKEELSGITRKFSEFLRKHDDLLREYKESDFFGEHIRSSVSKYEISQNLSEISVQKPVDQKRKM